MAKDYFRFWAGIVAVILGIILILIGFFTLFITWFYGIPIFIIGVLLLINAGNEEEIEKVKKRKR